MRVGVIGASGYAGVELVRLLLRHPWAKLTYLAADSTAGQDLAGVYPHLQSLCSLSLEVYSADRATAAADVALVALPAGRSGPVVAELLERGLRVIDLGGDYRLPGPIYEQWYHQPAPPSAVQAQAVYGLPEVFGHLVAEARLVANPGCYPTAALLALVPALQHGLVETAGIIIDAKSGVSGAGRGASLGTAFSEVNENCKAYKVGTHQHTPEIEAGLAAVTDTKDHSVVAGSPLAVTFTAHLIPMTRGILSTAYAVAKPGVDEGALREAYADFFRDAPFVRLLPPGQWPQTKAVLGSNLCDVALHVDTRAGRMVAMAAIDNLVKGAAGQAVQNLNRMAGWAEAAGLDQIPLYP